METIDSWIVAASLMKLVVREHNFIRFHETDLISRESCTSDNQIRAVLCQIHFAYAQSYAMEMVSTLHFHANF